MKLYTYFRSSSSWRVRIALNHKRVPHTIVPVHLLKDGGEQHGSEFRRLSPLGQVPVLEVPSGAGALYLTQSVAIIEYLEETYPELPLLPGSRELRAQTREFVELVNSGIQPLQNLRLQQELRKQGLEPAPFLGPFIEAGLEALERRVGAAAGRFAIGDQPSLADVFLVPQLYASRRLDIDTNAFPSLHRIEMACAELPAFQAARPEAQGWIARSRRLIGAKRALDEIESAALIGPARSTIGA